MSDNSDKADERKGPAGWPFPPLVVGDWKELTPEMLARTCRYLCEVKPREIQRRENLEFLRMRALPLGFYPGWLLLEAMASFDGDQIGVLRILWGPRLTHVLRGSMTLRLLNQDSLADLYPIRRAIDYLRFFSAATRAKGGTFRIVESLNDLEPGLVRLGKAEAVAAAVTPIKVLDRDSLHFESVIFHAGHVFKAVFKVDVSGDVQMNEDDPLVHDALAWTERFESNWQLYPHAPPPEPSDPKAGENP